MTNKTPTIKSDPYLPDEDSWNAWCNDPCTVYVASKLKIAADRLKSEWVQAAWDGVNANPELLLKYRASADAYMVVPTTNLGGYKNV